MSRFDNHPVLGTNDSELVEITVNGRSVTARDGDTIAFALWADGKKVLRRSKTGQPRGIFCGIGHCFECRLLIETEDGTELSVRSCLTPVSHDLVVRTDEQSFGPDMNQSLRNSGRYGDAETEQ